MKTKLIPSVFILNLSYTGLGLARAFSGSGIKVYGIGSKRLVCGNFSRYLHFFHSPDSLTQAKDLCEFCISFAQKEPVKPVIFPTRDHDIIFLMDHRKLLEKYFIYSQAENNHLEQVLNKWQLYKASVRCEVLSPKTILAENTEELKKISTNINYPALLKPMYASDWRKEAIWNSVGKRKAILIQSRDDLFESYGKFCHLFPKVLLQEYVEGEDSDIFTFCSYCNKNSDVLASFNTRKIRQLPDKFGTGIVVKSAINNELNEPSKRLLKHLHFSGISEIEYKRDPGTGKYYLIEINPRFWDQHRLSMDFGLNLALIAYNDLTGRNNPIPSNELRQATWIAEDAFIIGLLDKLWKDRRNFYYMLREVEGPKNFAMWNSKDPLPLLSAIFMAGIDILTRFFNKLFIRI